MLGERPPVGAIRRPAVPASATTLRRVVDDERDEQWGQTLAGLTELALERVTVVVMPPPNPDGRVRAGHGATMSLSGVLGPMIEPEGRGRDVLQFPIGDAESRNIVGHFGISRPAFRGCRRTPSGWLAIDLDGLHIMIRRVAEDLAAGTGPEREDDPGGG
ncbi:MAG: hypothetical protein QOF29_3513 [bacterium]